MTAAEMKAVETTVSIVCPAWCCEDAADHVAELDDWEGALVHRSKDDVIFDDRGSVTNIGSPIGDPVEVRYLAPLASHVHVTTDLAGQAIDSPGIVLDGRDITSRQARALAASLLRLAEMAEEWSERFDEYLDTLGRAPAEVSADA